MIPNINRRAAWSRQKELQKKYAYEDVPDIDELKNIIDSINVGKVDIVKQTKRAKALFAMYYLTACRVSEIVKVTNLWKKKYIKEGNKFKEISKEPIDHNYPGIKKGEIKFGMEYDKQCMYIRTENRKHKQRTTKRQPIPIELEQPIVEFIKDYIKDIDDDSILFNFKSKRATQIIVDSTDFNVHFIRHIRATHLVTKYDFNEQALIKFMGWTDARPAKNYMELSSKDIFQQFYKDRR